MAGGPQRVTEGGALLVLFDIDGTLLQGGATEHARAVIEAITDVWGVSAGENLPVDAAGRTDTEIAREILLLCGVDMRAVDDMLDDFREAAAERYVELVPDDLSARLAPQAGEVVAGLAARADMRLALVTGNLEPIARLKLARAGIGSHFVPGQGGFGSDSEDRTDLPPIARRRAAAWNDGAPWPAERTVVVGDTPRDIACARADGAHVVAVTTGPFAAERLEGADAVIDGLGELVGALEALRPG
jgi:phosphoglycolate phosphatase-like HAD superfamily hydrolase